MLFFSEASPRAGISNPRIWLANRALVTGPAFYDTDHSPDFYPRYSRQIEIVAKVYKQRQQLHVNNFPWKYVRKIWILKKMDSDESVHSESEFYYPEEEIPNETTALKYEEVEQDRQLSGHSFFPYGPPAR